MADSVRIGAIVAGVQKGGTTALHRRMKKNPEIGMPRGKESWFFFSEKVDWAAPDYDSLHERHNWAKRRVKIHGEATPNVIFLDQSHARIKAYNADMKLILLFRDPIERAFSQWKMFRYRRIERLSFSDAIREGRQRPAMQDPTSGRYKRYSYVERSLYARQLENLLQHFPREQMLLLMNEELRHKPDETLGRISQFLGVTNTWPDVGETRSLSGPDTGERITPEDHAYLRELFAEDHARFVEMTGLGGHWMRPKAERAAA
jgi:hypothetical protein